MSNPIQNFYKSTITQDWSIGTGNFYVSIKPTTSVGRLVVSPSSDTLREIIEYTNTGTDGNGDYIVISVRGVGGTTEQSHTVGEKVRMNITAEDWEDMRDDIDSIVAAGAPNASTVQKGIVEEATSAQQIAGTDTGETGARLFSVPSVINTQIDSKIAAIPAQNKLIGVGNSSNTSFENYQFLFGSATGQGWTSIGAPTYNQEKILTGSAVGVYKAILSLDTLTAMDFDNTKNKVLEWDAVVQLDATTGESLMGFSTINSAASITAQDIGFPNRTVIGFLTSANGSWSLATANGTTNTRTAITTPSAGKHTFRMEINPLTPSVLFYIDGTLVGTHTTNIPTVATGMYLLFGNGTSSVLIRALTAPLFAIQK